MEIPSNVGVTAHILPSLQELCVETIVRSDSADVKRDLDIICQIYETRIDELKASAETRLKKEQYLARATRRCLARDQALVSLARQINNTRTTTAGAVQRRIVNLGLSR